MEIMNKYLKTLLVLIIPIAGWGQPIDMNNTNMTEINILYINDPSVGEGLQWNGTASGWTIDVSPENRSNMDGNLNFYGISGNILAWRPFKLKGIQSNLLVEGTGTSYIMGNVGIGTSSPQNNLQIQGKAGEQSQGQIHIVGNGEGGPGDAYISFYEGLEAGSKWSLGVKDNGNGFAISHGLTMDAEPKLYINDVSGNVGIGTASPSTNLHLSTGTSGDALFRIEADTDNNNENDNPILEYRQDGGATRAEIGYISDNFFGIAQQGSLSGTTRPAIRFGVDLTGNVGIGTTSPAQLFHLQKSNTALAIRMERTGTYTGYSDIQYARRDNNLGVFFDSDLNINILSILQNGNVGIGTTTPQSELAVNGIITSTEVNVTATGWPDYVFHNDYQLKPLSEVQQFIRENHRLPDMPSTEVVEKEGVNLGEMNSKFLRKIEELTLYIIDLNKQVSHLNQKNSRYSPETSGKKIEELTLYMIELQKENEGLNTQNTSLLHRLEKIEKEVFKTDK